MMSDTQGINKLLYVVCTQNGQGRLVLGLHKALITSMSHRAAGTRHDHTSPKDASTLDSLHLHRALLGELEYKWMPEVSGCLKLKH